MVFAPRGKSPEGLAHNAEVMRLNKIRQENEQKNIGSKRDKEVSPELEERLREFDRITNEYLTFLYRTYYDLDAELDARSQQNEGFLEMSSNPISRLLHFRAGLHISSEEHLKEVHGERSEEDRNMRRVLEDQKRAFEVQLELFSDLFEDPKEVAYLSALDNMIKNRPSAQKS